MQLYIWIKICLFVKLYYSEHSVLTSASPVYNQDDSSHNEQLQSETKTGENYYEIEHIALLQWAIKIEGNDREAMDKIIEHFVREFALVYHGNVAPFPDWHLFSHVTHDETRDTLVEVMDYFSNHEDTEAFHEKAQLSRNKQNKVTSPSRLPVGISISNDSVTVARESPENNQTLLYLNRSTIHRIKAEYEARLVQQHNLKLSELHHLRNSLHKSLQNHPLSREVLQQKVKWRQKRSLQFEDPAFNMQWHLVNQREPGMDINVTAVWEAGYTGRGVTVCIVDDGLEWTNPDFEGNYRAEGSWDMIQDRADPMPSARKESNSHGTRCAGEVAAAANSVCGVGVAWEAGLSGIRMLDGPMTDAMEATAFTKNMHVNDIYSCSWGPADDGKTVDGPDFLAEEGLRHGVDFGRHGYGSLYVMASGNGGMEQDNCNFDGYANSIYTLTIGAVDEAGRMPYYAEQCASMLAVTFSSGDAFSRQIVTTDWLVRGASGCTESHTGTSAAAPLAAGMLALAVQANPCLMWRDYKYLVILTAEKVDRELSHYSMNAAGLSHSHQHGFGLMDAWRLVNAARVWRQVPFMTTFASNQVKVHAVIPPRNEALKLYYNVSADALDGYSLLSLEEVQVTVTVTHAQRGALIVTLTCPSGTQSLLAAPRPNDRSDQGFTDWTFTTVRCWGERPQGTYVLSVTDTGDYPVSRGQLVSWRLKLHGAPLSSQEWQQRNRQVKASYNGEYLSAEHQPTCQSAPESLLFTPPLSTRVLKVVAATALFCFVMSIYESLEYLLCYNDEKQETREQWRQAQARQGAGNSRTDYTLLSQTEENGCLTESRDSSRDTSRDRDIPLQPITATAAASNYQSCSSNATASTYENSADVSMENSNEGQQNNAFSCEEHSDNDWKPIGDETSSEASLLQVR